MSSVYVAGKYADYTTIRVNQKKCVDAGFTISYDWTAAAEKHNLGEANKIYALDALDDIDGVLLAKWTVLIMTDPDYNYRGTFCELGASIVRDMHRGVKRTIIVSSGMVAAADCCFFHHPNARHVATIDEALEIMKSETDHL